MRDEPSYLAPIEHLADSLQQPVRSIGVRRTNRGVNGLDVRAHDAHSKTRPELWKNVSIQCGLVVLPCLLFLLRVILDECLAQLIHSLQLSVLVDLILRIFMACDFAQIRDRLLARLIER